MKNLVQFISPIDGRVFNALLGDYRWAPRSGEPLVLSYSFYERGSPVYVSPRDGYERNNPEFDFPFRPGFATFSPQHRLAVRRIFDDIETFLDLRFVEVADSLDADIRFGLSDLLQDGYDGVSLLLQPKYTPFRIDPNQLHLTGPLSVDIWLEQSLGDARFPMVLLHEIGHALGLSHPFEDGFRELPPVSKAVLDGELDYLRYTAMAYDVYPDSVQESELLSWSPAVTFMSLDIQALQFLYGVDEDTDDDLYVVRDTGADPAIDELIRSYEQHEVHEYPNAYLTIADTGGSNTLLIAVDGDLEIDLHPGTWSHTGGGLRVANGVDDNLFLAHGSVLDELLLLGNGDHRVVVGREDFSTYKVLENGPRLYLREIDGGDTLLIEGAEELVFADLTLSVDGWRQQVADHNAPLLLDPQVPLYQSAIDGGVAGVADDIAPAEAQLYRLYFGGLGRAPDREGFEWWLDKIENGVYDLLEVSARFVDSPEFRGLADGDADGIVSDPEFLDHMYRNVFGRAPDEDGYAWWLAQLQSDEFTQPLGFAHMVQSDEFVLLTAGTVSDMLLV